MNMVALRFLCTTGQQIPRHSWCLSLHSPTTLLQNSLASTGHLAHIVKTVCGDRLDISNRRLFCTSYQKWKKKNALSLTKTPESQIDPNVNIPFRPIFYFPFIRFLGILQRVQLGTTVSLTPPVVWLLLTNNEVSVWLLGTFLGLNLIFLPIVCIFMPKIIGSIAVGGTKGVVDTVRISHGDFLGRRSEVYYKISEIVPLHELPETSHFAYTKLRIYGSRKRFYLCLRWGHILEEDTFEMVLGKHTL